MHGYVVPSRMGTFACTTLQLEFSVYSGKKSCKKPGINKQTLKKKSREVESLALSSCESGVIKVRLVHLVQIKQPSFSV